MYVCMYLCFSSGLLHTFIVPSLGLEACNYGLFLILYTYHEPCWRTYILPRNVHIYIPPLGSCDRSLRDGSGCSPGARMDAARVSRHVRLIQGSRSRIMAGECAARPKKVWKRKLPRELGSDRMLTLSWSSSRTDAERKRFSWFFPNEVQGCSSSSSLLVFIHRANTRGSSFSPAGGDENTSS